MTEKALIPPPADGSCVYVLCNASGSENFAPILACIGAGQVVGGFTICKVLMKNAAKLQLALCDWPKGDGAKGLGFVGWQIEKYPFHSVFENQPHLSGRQN
ncbi:hypothetical protein [Pseudomonas baetica]|uniref:hypothetical protein n=1 Tax=Pseudomonas baetica TaxID=674054 RepID=UPI0028721418|nr:hypothetical protein [Pseudomonas baetica]MDR9860811.1 hypothetical protein [Pseudomonas baetica]